MLDVQATYLINPSAPDFPPEWLEPDVAEQLRSSVEARALLQEEYAQVGLILGAPFPAS